MSTSWLDESIDDPNLRQSVQDLIKAYPASSRVIERMVRYYDNKPSDREAKRRKVEESNLSNDEVFRLLDVSFQLPARKKYNLIITRTRLLLHNSKTDTIEYQYSLDDLSPLGGACVPSPDKATKCNTFTLFSKKNDQDCLVFNSQDKVDIILRKPNVNDETLKADKHQIISDLLSEHARVPIAQPTQEFFRSTGVSATTGKVLEDKAHVVAYLKAKDGFLFFLPTGILFGFKKPTLFFPISSLASNVITNITQRTFDLTLTLKPGCDVLGSAGFRTTKEGDNDTVQFSMIEQSEYQGIEAYTKKLDVNDHSMAEERKAPVSSTKKENNNDVDNDDEDEDEDEDEDDATAKANLGQDDLDEDSEENDEDFEPSDNEHEPLEYDTDADEEEADRELAQEETHEYEDAMSENDEEEQDLLDEDDD